MGTIVAAFGKRFQLSERSQPKREDSGDEVERQASLFINWVGSVYNLPSNSNYLLIVVGVYRPTLQILTLDHISDQYLLGNVRKYQGIFVSENERYQL